ncbi:hypothetical protein [Bacillus vallismortis]|uniref:hypothetical protein n=1 Tax=Bacillus vallismortis TaxID=72361 RepID=UPI0020919750|nr:hypothetical protein [Bacillus vallismortis]MCO4850741.1 hypothetical protein [Bacillus vallismortis]
MFHRSERHKDGNFEINDKDLINKEIKKKIEEVLEDTPLQININLYLTQEQNPELTSISNVKRAAIAMKESNAAEDTRDSAIAQEKSNAVDKTINSGEKYVNKPMTKQKRNKVSKGSTPFYPK